MSSAKLHSFCLGLNVLKFVAEKSAATFGDLPDCLCLGHFNGQVACCAIEFEGAVIACTCVLISMMIRNIWWQNWEKINYH